MSANSSTQDYSEPYIEKPDYYKPDEATRFCFLNPDRLCSSECMAYLVERPDGQDYEGQQWAVCMLLVNLHRCGKHLAILASQGGALLKEMKVKLADEKRINQTVPSRGV